MKILYIITSTETGGAEKALAALSEFMVRQGHLVKVLSIKPLGKIAPQMRQAGVEVQSVHTRFVLQTILKIRKEIENFQPDIIHGMLFRGIEYARLACHGKTIPLVTTPHFDLSKKSLFLRLADRFLQFKDTLSIVESFSTAEYLVGKQSYPKDKVYFLPNSVDKIKFYKDVSLRASMRKRYSFHVKTIVFICVARLAAVKDPITLLQAFRNVWLRHPETKLVFVGEGGERARLESYIRQSGMEKAVILAGEQTDINAYLNMADVFVLPSIEESLPLALLEAICVGLPCIVSRVGDMPLWVEHGENGYVFAPQDITTLSCFLSLLAEDNSLRQSMGEKSLEKSRQILDNITKYQHIYQQLITGSFHVKTNE